MVVILDPLVLPGLWLLGICLHLQRVGKVTYGYIYILSKIIII